MQGKILVSHCLPRIDYIRCVTKGEYKVTQDQSKVYPVIR